MIQVHPDEIIDECRRRVEAKYHPTVQSVIVGDGGDPASAMLLEVERLRACQDHLLAMTPLPHNYRSDHFWQGYPPGFRFQTVVNQVQGVQQPAPVAAPVQAQQPQIIVVPVGGGGQQVVLGGMGTDQARVVSNPPMMAAPSEFVQHPVYSVPPQMGMPSPACDQPVMQAAPQPMQSPSPYVPPVSNRSAPPQQPQPAQQQRRSDRIWSANHEAMAQAATKALDGDVASQSLLRPFANEMGLDLNTFCQRLVSERARTLEVWTQIEGRTV